MFHEVYVPGLIEFKAACEVAGVPGWYAEREYAYRAERPAERWPRGTRWTSAVTSTLQRWRDAGSPISRGNGSSCAKNSGVWDLKQKLELLQKQIREHPANETSSCYTGDPTDDEIANLERLRIDLTSVEKTIAAKT